MVSRVLAYLEGRRRVAEYYGNRSDARDYDMAWVTLFEAYHGRNPLPALRHSGTPTLPRTNPNVSKPWYREKYGKPMRRVMGYVEVLFAGAEDDCGGRWYECALQCGHVSPAMIDLEGVARPKHKRCGECPPAETSTASAMGVAELPGGGPALDKRTVPPGCKKPVSSEKPPDSLCVQPPRVVDTQRNAGIGGSGLLSAHRGL